MKKCCLLTGALFFIANVVLAQDEEEVQRGFKKENLFTGGSVTVSFFSGQTVLGANPMFGYKIANWIDAGLAFNIVYTGARDYNEFGDKIRQTTWGPGVFTRLYPVSFLFVQAQMERNFSTLKYYAAPNSFTYMDGKISTSANSLLLGAGWAQGRETGSNSFYYISLLFDVLKNRNSPYVDVAVNPNNPNEQRVSMTPIIRAGFNIGLFGGRYR
jgi:hypothetical protein